MSKLAICTFTLVMLMTACRESAHYQDSVKSTVHRDSIIRQHNIADSIWANKESVREALITKRAGLEACWPKPNDLTGITIGFIDSSVNKVRSCEPHRELFTSDHHLRNEYVYNGAPNNWGPSGVLWNLQEITGHLSAVSQAFNYMPAAHREKVLPSAVAVSARYIVSYLPEDYLKDWVLNLDYVRDIDPINPAWYSTVKWDDDSRKKVSIPERNLRLSKVEMWVRMFWRRRGEVVFNMARSAVKEELAKKRSAGTN